MSALLLFLLLLLLLQITTFSFVAAQQATGNISLGASLYANNNSSWLSNSGQFAFGFYTEGKNLAVGIWYAKIQQKTIVWTANRDAPLPLSNDVKLLLSGEGIRVMAPDNQVVSATISNIYEPAASASMLDSGNFVLYNSNSKIIWQSFGTPTDTIVSGQRLLAGNKIVSSISDTNHASGRFRVSMQRDGNLVQYPEGPIVVQPPQYAYWSTGTYRDRDNVSLNLDHNGQLYLLNSTNYNIWNATNQTQLFDSRMYRLTIDFDGILRLYSHSLIQNDSWSVQWSSSSNKCAPRGLCGLNAYCVPIDQDPPCVCLPGFVFIDQRQGDVGCRRNVSTVGCPDKNGITYSIADVDGLVWENTPYSVLNINETACKEDCLRDCNCEAAVYRDQRCQKQRLPLRFGKTDENSSTLIKIGNSGTKTVSKARKEQLRTGIFIGGIAMLTFSLIILAITGLVIYRYCVGDYKKISNSANGGFVENVTLRSYTYTELEKATKGFSDQVGKGAFGTVYKGVISANGGRVVAIKKLENVVDQGDREFRNEMNAIGRTHHKNLVKLLGYCHEGSNRLLVYEYMTNGSLAHFLFRSDERPTWEERIGICLNVARGILYLHEECDTQIIHCDIKPENILMSDQKCAKLADFGLAKLLKSDQTRTYTGLRGTRGYVAPEWHRNDPITVKADVFSFGVVLLEIICCRRSVNMDIPEDQVILENWVYHCLESDELDKLVKDEDVDKIELRRMVKVGLWCIQDELAFRPSMKTVLLMLEGTVEIPNPPSLTSVSSSIS